MYIWSSAIDEHLNDGVMFMSVDEIVVRIIDKLL